MEDKNSQINKCLLLIHRTQKAEHVERLYELINPTIRHIGLKYLHDYYLADDFVQDFWADIILIAEKYSFCYNGFAYLCKVATNRAINQYRKHKREDAYITYVDYSEYRTAVHPLNMDHLDLHIMVDDALARLPEVHRIIIQSTYFEDKTIREIAKELKMSKSQVGRLKTEALELLKNKLAHIN